MIALTLLVLIGLYVVLFVVVGFKTKSWLTRLTGWGILLAPLIWKTWDIPVGYYHFQKLCEAEAGFKVNVPNPVPAKIIRTESYAHYYAESVLRKHPSIVAVEAQDKMYDYISKPIAFSLYERGENGTAVSHLLDKVGKMHGRGEVRVLESAPSSADYIAIKTLDYPGNRVSRWRQELRHKDGTVIATSTSLDYTWSNPANTLFAQSFRTDRCGSWELAEEFDKLLDLIAPRAK